MVGADYSLVIQNIFIALWIGIFALLCFGIKRALRHSVREGQKNLRRYTREYYGSRRTRRHSAPEVVAAS